MNHMRYSLTDRFYRFKSADVNYFGDEMNIFDNLVLISEAMSICGGIQPPYSSQSAYIG